MSRKPPLFQAAAECRSDLVHTTGDEEGDKGGTRVQSSTCFRLQIGEGFWGKTGVGEHCSNTCNHRPLCPLEATYVFSDVAERGSDGIVLVASFKFNLRRRCMSIVELRV